MRDRLANEYLNELSKYYESDKSNRFSKASLADLILFVLFRLSFDSFVVNICAYKSSYK